jgi:hypothetical protein
LKSNNYLELNNVLPCNFKYGIMEFGDVIWRRARPHGEYKGRLFFNSCCIVTCQEHFFEIIDPIF